MKRLLLVALLALAHPALAQIPDTLPTLPKVVQGPAGPIEVVILDSLFRPDGVELMGAFLANERRVYLSAKITSRAQQYQTLFHELCHIAIIGSGLRYLPIEPTMQEMLCDAVASTQVANLYALTRAKR